MSQRPVLIAGEWINHPSNNTFQCLNPTTGTLLEHSYPVSDWKDCDHALDAAVEAFLATEVLASRDGRRLLGRVCSSHCG